LFSQNATIHDFAANRDSPGFVAAKSFRNLYLKPSIVASPIRKILARGATDAAASTRFSKKTTSVSPNLQLLQPAALFIRTEKARSPQIERSAGFLWSFAGAVCSLLLARVGNANRRIEFESSEAVFTHRFVGAGVE
jgi:hypothetical protein